MPYTPPAQSPASSKSASPAVSRSSSYCEDVPRSPITGRPQLPRSMSSASYMTRHRRTPSVSYTEMNTPPTPTEADQVQVSDFTPSASLRQSPPPVNNLVIPTGAIISPPDSSENSDGDESQEQPRGRALEIKMLQEAVRVIDLKREPSPETTPEQKQIKGVSTSEPVSQSVSPTALSAEARKISHSRSATETAIQSQSMTESPVQTSDDEEDEGPHSKPALVRKKSGELVKPALRPSSRRRYSSMPGTPTYHKSVHFNDNDNQTRHFLQVDKPIAVSAGSSPVETYESEAEYPFTKQSRIHRDIKLANFPADLHARKTQEVRVERIFLSSDKNTLIGTCAVQNLAFHKRVAARFTYDYWKTTSEVVAEYVNDPRNPSTDGCDRFNFHIKLSDAANIDEKTLLLCVRYSVNGEEYWDNNRNMNYQIDFVKSTKKSVKVSKPQEHRDSLAIPRSKHSPTSTHTKRGESVDDDFGSRIDNAYMFGPPETFITDAPTSIKLKPKTKRTAAQAPAGNNLGGRYDFGASLSAALTHAQEKLGKSSGLLSNTQARPEGNYFGIQDRKGPSTNDSDKPSFAGDRPAIGSDQYKDLVQKFCYFTSNGSGKGVTSPNPAAALLSPKSVVPPKSAQTDGADDLPIPSPDASLDGSNDAPLTPSIAELISQSSSPVPISGQDYSSRVQSPTGFGYPYYNKMHDGYFNESPHQSTAILG